MNVPTILPKSGPGARFLASLPPDVAAAIERHAGVTAGELDQAPQREPERIERWQAGARAKPKKLAQTRAEKRAAAVARRQRQRDRDAATESRILDAVSAKIVNAGGARTRPQGCPVGVWRMCWQVRGDATGGAARVWLKRTRDRAQVAAIIRAALWDGHEPPEGNADALPEVGARSWAQDHVRCIAAIGLALAHMAERTRRRGKWNGLVKGFGQGFFAALLHDPFDQRPAPPGTYANGLPKKRPGTPHTKTIFGKRSDDDAGYLHTLIRAGLLHMPQQLRAEYVSAAEKNGPSGHSYSRYWIVTSAPIDTIDPEVLAQLAQLIGEAAESFTQWDADYARRKTAPPPTAGPPPS